jgi:hypothetical protein
MQISQLDPTQADRFGSTHTLHYALNDGRQIVLLSGVVNVEMQSPGWMNENAGTNLFEDDLTIELALPGDLVPNAQRFRIIEAVPYLSLNAITGFSNVGWGVTEFQVAKQEAGVRAVRLEARVAVSRSGEILSCVAYHITLIGEVVG